MTTPTPTAVQTVNLTINGQAVSVPKGTTVYQASKQVGAALPIFCYHDRMAPFGACRVCLVEVDKMGKLQTSCTLEATEGMVVKTESQLAVEGRKSILEFLLINHPLDCPICDRGGECPLQDNAMNYGPGESRFFEEKRHFKKPIALGHVLMLDRERCIVCARCTRFGELIAGDSALQFIERGYRTEVGTPHGRPVESKFIGNTIKICPVGALTSQVYRFRARPWDNHSSNTTCTLCPVGCSMILDSRDGEIMRTRSEENKEVNDIWMCDKGWFGYEFSSSGERLKEPLVRRNGKLKPASWDEALYLVAAKFQEATATGKIAGLGGNPLTTEESYLFQKLIREVGGVNHVDHRVGMPLVEGDEGLTGMEMTIGECEQLSYAVILGTDLTEEFPVIWLRLKQAMNCGAKVLFLGHYAPEVAQHLTKTVVHQPGHELEILKEYLPQITAWAGKGGKGALFVGRQYLGNANRAAILSELLKFRQATPDCALNILEGKGNSHGAAYAGMLPDRGPMGKLVNKPGLNAQQVFETAAKDGWGYLHVAGANPAKQMPSSLWQAARAKLGFLVVQDLFLTETAKDADVVLPTLSFVEKEGSFINVEGRVSKLHPGKAIPEAIHSDAAIFTQLAKKLNQSISLDSGFSATLKPGRLKSHRPEKIEAKTTHTTKAREGALLATFAPELFDHGARMKHNTHLVQQVKEPCVRLHPTEAKKHSVEDGSYVKLSANGHTLSAKVQCDTSIAPGTVVIPLGIEQLPAYEFGLNLLNGLPIEIK